MSSRRAVVRLTADCFGDSVVCSGRQIAAVAQLLEQETGPLQWLVSGVVLIDLDGDAPDGGGSEDVPVRCGSTAALTAWATGLGDSQVVWGVATAFRIHAAPMTGRTSASVADDLWRDMGDAIAEIQAVDTSFVAVSLSDPGVASAIQATFRGAVIERR